MNPAMRPPEEEWDPEYTPKSRKYYLVSVSLGDAAERASDFLWEVSDCCRITAEQEQQLELPDVLFHTRLE